MEENKETSKEDKTEEPTEEKQTRAREEGNVTNPREIVGAFGILIITIYLYFYSQNLIYAFEKSFQNTWININPRSVVSNNLWNIIYFSAKPVMPFFLFLFTSLAIFPVLIGLGLTRFNWSTRKIELDLTKISILPGLKRIFGFQSIIEALKLIIKLTVLTGIIYFILKSKIPFYERFFQLHLNVFAVEIGKSVYDLLFAVVASSVILGIFDYGYNYWKLRSDLKMSKQEIKEENKRHEGDPLVKSQRKRFGRDLIFRKALKEVPKATFIVTNPEHFAIAIKYVKGMRAPIVVAKGIDHLAFRIREIAKKHDIMIVENKPLARALYKQVKIGREIPQEFYQSVIEVMKYIYKIRGKQYFERMT